jgi:hypothetical protein
MTTQENLNKETLKIQAQFIIENINKGMSFEEATEKSFLDMNIFLNRIRNSQEFKNLVSDNILAILK